MQFPETFDQWRQFIVMSAMTERDDEVIHRLLVRGVVLQGDPALFDCAIILAKAHVHVCQLVVCFRQYQYFVSQQSRSPAWLL